jgi:hypothetical protein
MSAASEINLKQAFLEKYMPDPAAVPVAASLAKKYAERLPAGLLDLWQAIGWGWYGAGRLQLIDPQQYQAQLNHWLMRDDDDGREDRTPFALSAFGHLFYWRILSEDGDCDVSGLNPHDSCVGVLGWSWQEFVQDFLLTPDADAFLDYDGLLLPAQKRCGLLLPNQMYGFIPALRLGGAADANKVEPQDARVHLDLLCQLALDE